MNHLGVITIANSAVLLWFEYKLTGVARIRQISHGKSFPVESLPTCDLDLLLLLGAIVAAKAELEEDIHEAHMEAKDAKEALHNMKVCVEHNLPAQACLYLIDEMHHYLHQK